MILRLGAKQVCSKFISIDIIEVGREWIFPLQVINPIIKGNTEGDSPEQLTYLI